MCQVAMATSQQEGASTDRLADARVLVLGGSRFMGPPCVRQLLAAGARVTILNRGKSKPAPDMAAILPDVTHIKCDRGTPAFVSYIAGSGRWDLVIDFICYDVSDLTPLLKALQPQQVCAAP
eukprot:SAG11_NODE_193_length_12862_cov_7.128888_4_plen_122_part_00